MRAAARALAPVIVLVIALNLTGCIADRRPDADVAKSVEQADRKRLETVVLASADEDALPVVLPVAGQVETSVAPAPAPDAAEVAAYVPVESFSIVIESNRFASDDADPDRASGQREGSSRRPHLGLNLFRLTVAGRPVSLRCSLKHKFLMFGAKITL